MMESSFGHTENEWGKKIKKKKTVKIVAYDIQDL